MNQRRTGSIARKLEEWFVREQRPLPWRGAYDPYQVWVSEVMLQQTRMEVVLRYFDRFIERFPTLHALAGAGEEEVLSAWSGLGYYRRARMLWGGANDVVDRFSGEVPRDHAALRSIAGIGRYTAGAISSIAFNERHPIVDGNVARVVARLESFSEQQGTGAFDKRAWDMATALVEAAKSPRDFNQGLMEFGALICRPRNPLCHSCFLARSCQARRQDAVSEFPKPPQRKKSERLFIPLFLVPDERGRILMRKENGRLMSAMFHLPHGSAALLEPSTESRLVEGRTLGTFRHTITNRQVEFRVCTAALADGLRDEAAEYAWVDPEELGTLPHPSYVSKAIEIWKRRGSDLGVQGRRS